MSQLIRRTWPTLNLTQRLYCASKSTGAEATSSEKSIPKNVLEDVNTAHHQENGVIYDKKPFKLHLDQNKVYYWCACGRSKHQPFCDNHHRNIFLRIKQRPIKFKVEKTGDYWLCNCKQTKHRPFCDGTHKQPDIQAAVK